MALQKEIQLDNGIVTNYHMIKQASFNFVEGQSVIQVENYVSKDIRENLKEIDEISDSIDKLLVQADKAERDGDTDLIESLSEKIHTLNHRFNELSIKTFSANSDNILLDSVPEKISLSDIYKLLKTTDKYAKAKKV